VVWDPNGTPSLGPHSGTPIDSLLLKQVLYFLTFARNQSLPSNGPSLHAPSLPPSTPNQTLQGVGPQDKYASPLGKE